MAGGCGGLSLAFSALRRPKATGRIMNSSTASTSTTNVIRNWLPSEAASLRVPDGTVRRSKHEMIRYDD